jgi:thiol-disulfide isomerase/thioredoxin
MSRLFSVTLAPALGLALLALPLAGCDRESGTKAQPQAENKAAAAPAKQGPVSRQFAGAALPAFIATDPSGKTLDLAGLKGQPVMLNLWATWCAPCKAEMPVLDAIAGANAGKLRVVTVSQDMKGKELVVPYFTEATSASAWAWPTCRRPSSTTQTARKSPASPARSTGRERKPRR